MTAQGEKQPSKIVWLPRFFIALSGAVAAHDTATMLFPVLRHHSGDIALVVFIAIMLLLFWLRVKNKTAFILAILSVVAVLCFGRVLIATVGYPPAEHDPRYLPPELHHQ